MKKKIIIILCVVLSLAIALGAVFHILRKPNKKEDEKPEENTSSTVSVEEPLKNTENSDSSAVEITDDGTGLKPDETKADEILSSAEKKTSSVYNEPVLQPDFLGRRIPNNLPHRVGAYHRKNLRRIL